MSFLSEWHACGSTIAYTRTYGFDLLVVYGTQEPIYNCSEDFLPRTFSSSAVKYTPSHPSKNTYLSEVSAVFMRACTADNFFQHCKPWSTLNSFNDACRSCQSGMWLQHTYVCTCIYMRCMLSISATPVTTLLQEGGPWWSGSNTHAMLSIICDGCYTAWSSVSVSARDI